MFLHSADGYATGLGIGACPQQPAWEQVTGDLQQLLGSFDRANKWAGTFKKTINL